MNQLAHSLESKSRSKDVIVEDHSVSFESFLLPAKILQGLNSCGFRKPSPIQVKAIPVGRCGLDLIVKSKSGTGKTLVFAVVALEGLKLHNKGPQVLILAPTREIAVQIEDVLKDVGQFFDGLLVETFIGGLPLDGDLTRCNKCHIAIGTPGRVKQLITMGYLDTNQVRLFVLDEADKLMENSFQNDINEIYNTLPNKKQVLMCSATYPKEMESFLGEYMLSPTFVSAEIDTPLLLGLKQFVRVVKSPPNVVQQTKVKNEELLKILSSIPFTQCLVFSNFQTRAESVSNFLNRNNFQSTFISAAQNQVDRLTAIHDLKQFKCKILLSTDLTSRGIDAANVDLVVNYDIPTDTMTYLHRMGRAGRYGSAGICVNLAAQGHEVSLLQSILGSIGGTNLSIPKLDDSLSIEKVDLSKENLLYGLINKENGELGDTIRTEVIENKKQGKRAKLKSKEDLNEADCKKKIVDHTIDDPLLILSELASENFDFTNSVAVNGDHNKINFDPNSILEQLSSENKPSETKNFNKTILKADTKVCNVEDILKQLASGENLSSFEIVKEQPSKTEDVLNKNKALFSIAKSLSNCATSKDDSESLAKYLKEIQKRDSLENCKILSAEHDNQENNNYTKKGRNEQDDLKVAGNSKKVSENIFTLAYSCAISDNGTSWKDIVLSRTEMDNLREQPDQEKSSYFEESQEDEDFVDSQQDFEDYSDDNYDPDYDFEIEKDVEINFAENSDESNDCIMQNSEEHTFMKWVPVQSCSKSQNAITKYSEKNQKSPKSKRKNKQISKNTQAKDLNFPSTSNSASLVIESYCEEYQNYFDMCNDSLWQNGLSFESVDKFDEWFWYDWQSQVSAVRECIRQKIYVEEMSRYQQAKN